MYIQINWQNPQTMKISLYAPWLLYSTTFPPYKSEMLSAYNRLILQANTDI